jgi:Tol biopolymer transport system component
MQRLIVLAAAAVAIAALIAIPAAANAPGTNGRVAFSRFDPTLDDDFVYTADPDGSHEQQLLSTGAEGPAWSPDGSEVMVSPHETLAAARIVNVDDGSDRDLAMPDPGLLTFCATWSPDGARLACTGFGSADPARNGIYTIRSSDGGGLVRITSNPNGEDDAGAYSPNGKRLVFLHFDRTRPDDPVALYIVKLDGGDPVRITPPGLFPDFYAGRWSPRGNEIVFSGKYSPTDPSSLFVVHTDGSDLRQIAVDNADGAQMFAPSWSPDGQKIIFSLRTTPGARADLYSVNKDGSNLTQVTDTATFSENAGADWGSHLTTD